MALLDRVSTLIRANLNDLIDKAENPEKLLKQLLLDMQNQFLQVKTQVAIAIADQHLLEKKHRENLALQAEWVRKAELALTRQQEDLARTALERSLVYENAAVNFGQQLEDQSHQVQTLREALQHLEQKMSEARTKTDLLMAQHRRAKLMAQTGSAVFQDLAHEAAFGRLQSKVSAVEALGEGHLIAAAPDGEQRLLQLERSDRINRLLAELKAKQGN